MDFGCKIKVRIIIAVLALLCLEACNHKKTEPATTDADSVGALAADSAVTDDNAAEEAIAGDVPRAADELFDDFFFNFSVNRKLQKERTVFPLKSVNGNKTEYIERNNWRMDYFFMKQGYYTLLFDDEKHMRIVNDTTLSHAIVEKIYFNTSSVIQYVFNRENGLWMLTSLNTIPISASDNATFLEFFHKFATDSAFQQNSLDETVQFSGPDPDDDFSRMEGIITADTWEAFAPQLPQKMIYNIIYGSRRPEGNRKIFLMRGVANGMELEMTFVKKNSQWRLAKLST